MVKEQIRTQRQTSYTGTGFDDFSKFMYEYRDRANKGFTFVDIDGIIRNYVKKQICLIEVKTFQNGLTVAQNNIANELDRFIRRGVCDGWTYRGFYVIVFEKTSFLNGRCWINGSLVSENEFLYFLSKWF